MVLCFSVSSSSLGGAPLWHPIDTGMLAGFDSLPVTHVIFNSIVPFATDPWISIVSDFFHLPTSFCYWVIFSAGLLFGTRPLSSIVGAALVIAMCGFDSVLLRVFAWLPWILIGTSRFQREGELSLLVIELFLGMRLTYSAGPLVCISFLFLAGSTLWITKTGAERTRGALCLLLLGFGIAVTAHTIPNLPKFDYPITSQVQARVVPDDGVPGTIQPLLGPAFPFQVIDIQSTQKFLLAPFFIAFAATLLMARRSLGAWILLGLIGFDLFTTGELHLLSPLEALSRMIPGAFIYPAINIALATLVWTLFSHSGPFRIIVTTVVAVLSLQFRHSLLIDLSKIQSSWGASPVQLASPSLAVFTRATPKSAESSDWQSCDSKAISLHQVSKTQLTNPTDLINTVTDGNPKTRISLGQDEGNALTVCFQGAPPKALWLDVGDFVTDFPRNFSVFDFELKKPIEAFSPWLGPIRTTPELHLPYYGPQSDVQIKLEKISSSCIDIRLDSNNPTFDWSVAELRCAF